VTPAERLKSPRVRLFVALDLPDPYLDELTAWQEAELGERGELRLLSRFSLHVTLVFLGYQAERDIDRIGELAFSERPQAFELRATEVVEVPPRRPRLYALAMVDEGEALARWQAGLSERLHDARLYEPEKRPFWPHVTIARFKREGTRRDGGVPRGARGGRARGGPGPAAGPLPELPEDLQAPLSAERLTLYRSTLRPQGAEYEALSRIELAT
jgi:RNA 2',3'-cyclic 3'-phosphodiesterase